jgi:hypothetical protein
MERHCYTCIEKQYSLGDTWDLVRIRYMHARIVVCFFGRNMQTKWYVQSATLQDGLMVKVEKVIFIKMSYVISQ